MRIFVLGTGRCGSTTFSKACSHITNYTSGHETCRGQVNIKYPDNHIEIDPHLVWNLPLLKLKYKGAYFVHLLRERDACIASLSRRVSTKNLWIPFVYQKKSPSPEEIKKAASNFYDNINLNISILCPEAFIFKLETWKIAFPRFWRVIEAKGGLGEALAEFKIFYNKD